LIDFNYILIPINNKFHWTVAKIDIKNKNIFYYDSLFGENNHSKSIINVIVKFFDEFLQNSNLAIENGNNRKINSICIDMTSDKIDDETTNTNKDNSNEILNDYYETDDYPNYYSFNKNWKVDYGKCNKQNNLNDCGVFTCKFLDYLSLNKIPSFTQEDIEYFRIQIAIELINENLMTM